MLSGKLSLLAVALLLTTAACHDVQLPQSNICFGDHIVPLLARDCASCHENGEYLIQIQGKESDHHHIEWYIDKNRPDDCALVEWAAGYERHPVVWPKSSAERTMVVEWIAEGAHKECLDWAQFGECKENHHCKLLACLCPDFTVQAGQFCLFDGTSGECATDGNLPGDPPWGNCIEPRFGLCKSDDTQSWAAQSLMAHTKLGIPVRFEAQIAPLLKGDCSHCHSLGEYVVTLAGELSDYGEVMRYVDLESPANSDFLGYAIGQGKHLIIWPPTSPKYAFFLQWLLQGAKKD